MVQTVERFSIYNFNDYLNMAERGPLKRKDLSGSKFGKLSVQRMIYGEIRGGKKRTQCECRCDCGNVITTTMDSLTSGKKTSCGCDTSARRIAANRINLVGERFGSLVVLEMLWEHRPTKARCVCDCGNTVIVSGADLRSGHTRSCGCLQKRAASEANTKDWEGIISPYGVEFLRQDYKNSRGQWLWECRCGECGNTFVALPAKVMNGHTTSCGCRRRSSKEELIESILKSRNIDYREQYRIPDCRASYTLPFDFAIFESGSLRLLIEYDGKQHYIPVPHFGGEAGFKKRQERDAAKDAYCKANNITLLRLPYTLTDNEIKNKIINTIYPERL